MAISETKHLQSLCKNIIDFIKSTNDAAMEARVHRAG